MDRSRCDRKHAHANGAYVMMSNHDFEGTPDQEELLARFFVMQALGGDLMKLAVMPQNQDDVLELLATATIMKDYYAEIPSHNGRPQVGGLPLRHRGGQRRRCT